MQDIKHLQNCCMEKYSTFKIGGEARCVWFPNNEEEFVHLLKNIENPLVIGSGSNILFSSSFIDKDIILTSNLDKYSLEKNILTVEAGVKAPQMANYAANEGLSGIEFLIGFPARFGGAVTQNASAQGQAISDTFLSAKVFDMTTKEVKEFQKKDMDFSYRHSILSSGKYILISAKFELKQDTVNNALEKIKQNLDFRKNHQPMLNLPNIGSIFLNPQNDSAGRLLDQCGFKGRSLNGACVWENHANFIVNLNNAKSTDVLSLIMEMKQKVKDKFNIDLYTEIRFIEGNNEEEIKLWKLLQK